ncbi:hypothetical protein F1L61_02080 [Campylobacter coli]|uniref:Uncharacterized protein n=1 Tax=Campylobacter coli TaxID=195 RepID=A0A825GHL1_CAMCO|nr:hypothetical protein [Campylobacter coli]EAH4673092.1 hypothetical protein [Campylobacter coli]EAH5729618.1 hypothetical protein [Campylobacter coli]EAI9403213.1 hypothetical protein [Campylobacter coli]EAI9414436.1 hypothetical protein [Campylobacter coli]
MENFKAFKLISKRIIKTLLNDFPNKSILFYDDFIKECEIYKIDFVSCIYFLKECKVLKYDKENNGDFSGVLISPKAYLYFSKNDLKDIDDLIEFCTR